MKNSVKIFFGLSMPALALVALWLWRLNRPQKQLQNNAKTDDEQKNAKTDDEQNNAKMDDEQKNVVEVSHDDSKSNHSVSESSDKDSSSDSPAESVGSDQKKEVSSDPEASQNGLDSLEETWEIEFPQALCGRLIGKKGKNVQKISQITRTKIRLIPQKDNTESTQRLVSLTGTPKQLSLALKKLQEKFPSVPFTRLNGGPTAISPVVLPVQQMFNVYITNIVDAAHFYVQLYDQNMSIQGQLQQLDQQMYHFYSTPSQDMAVSNMPHPLSPGMICASLQSPTGWWWRAQVVGLLMKPDEVEIAWLDYGGKTTVPTSNLRLLREDFMQLPFQAVECYLSNVIPHQGETSFSMTACAFFEGLAQNNVLTARITSYNRECPCLELYAPQWSGQPIFINRELVRRGCVRWLADVTEN